MNSRFKLLAIALLTLATSAWAQYVATPQAGVSYPALTNATPVPLMGIATAAANDVGRATLPLGFSFPYFGQNYTQVIVSANGFIALEPIGTPTATFDTNTTIPSNAEPNAFIAPFWDDLIGDNASSAVRQQALSGPFGTGLAIEWRNWNRKATAHDLNFQVRLWSNGMIEFFYGTMVGSGIAPTATIGIEAPGGVSGLNALANCITNQCNLTAFDPGNTGVRVSYIRIGPPAGADLQASGLRVDGITQDDAGVLTISTRLSMRNFGTLDAGSFTYKLRLAQNTVPGLGDVLMTPLRQGPFTLGALEPFEHSAQSLVPRPDAGAFYVMAELDDQNQVSETLENNNLITTSVAYAAGIDFVAERVSTVPVTGPNEPLTINADFSNQGFEAAGTVQLKAYASLDALLDGTDVLLGTGSIVVAGGQNVSTNFTVTVPGNIRSGDYYVLLSVDDPNVITERSELNNVARSADTIKVLQADLIVEDFKVLKPVSPFLDTTTGFFGEPLRFEVTVRNQGGASVPDAGLVIFMSDNETLNGSSDPAAGEVANLNLAPGGSQRVVLSPNLPTMGTLGQTLARGAYFFFAAAIAPSIRESDATNNFIRSEPVIVRAPAPNLTPLSVQGPLFIGGGEIFAVTRTLSNNGSRAASNVAYRYFLSANTIITKQDTPLKIVTAAGDVDSRSLAFAAGQIDSQTEFLRVPPTASQGTQYLGVLMDPEGLIDETEKDDNGLAGTLLTLSPQGLALSNDTLPDALVGSPYFAQLVATGATGVTFEAKDMAELPPGIALSSAGNLTGQATRVGTYPFTVVLRAGGRLAEVRQFIRVSSTTATLSVTTTQLPAPARSLPYEAQLGVVGGHAPYTWTLVAGLLPSGLVVSPDGHITGVPNGALGVTSTFAFRVNDVSGNVDTRTFTLTVVDLSPVVLSPPRLDNGIVGVEYIASLSLRNSSAAAVSRPVRWALIGGSLPPGLAFEPSTSERIVLSGTPTTPGISEFRVEATDGQGRTDSLGYVMVVSVSGVSIDGQLPERVKPGAGVSVQFTVAPKPAGVKYFLLDGALPSGLALDEATGVISGTVASDAKLGAYNTTFAVGPSRSAVYALKALHIEISNETDVAKKPCGCTTNPSLGALALLGWTLLRRRRARG